MRLTWYKNLLPESNSQTTPELREFINNGMCLFDTKDRYPIWDEGHREELEKRIIEHYACRQIGFETWGRFKHEVNVRMHEIMPYYVQIYKTTKYEYNPIENYSMTEEFNDKNKTEGTSDIKGNERISDTPQNSIDNIDTHMSSASKTESTTKTGAVNDNVHTGWRRGNIGVTSSQQLIQAERDITINIDKLIIDELQDLFLGVY